MSRGRKIVLKDLLQRIDWVQFQQPRNKTGLQPNEVAVGFMCKTTETGVNQVRVRIGSEVMEKLNWMIGERANVFHHPDDLMSFMIVKSENREGYKLLPDHKGQAMFGFKWTRDIPLTARQTKPVDYLIHPKSKYLVFRVGDTSIHDEEYSD